MNFIKYLLLKTMSVCLLLLATTSMAQAPTTYTNPIIPGFHPDPSITRVADDYYLVNSSFNWFPGIPIFHSKDLVNWQQIGHVLDRPEQLMMQTPGNAGGVWAPTIRYHNGLFYVIVTCKQCINACNCGDNFYVTAKNPAGPWSDPIWVDASHGIDPTLFWDDDGTSYYIGSTHALEGGREWPAQDKIYISEIDLKTGKLLTEPMVLTSGHATNAKYAEGPHIYKINGTYVLMISEGGTWNNHAVTTFTAKKVTGPYSPTQINPVMTHRHLGNQAEITTLGHADLVETQNGDWWAVLLGCRPIDGQYYLGRETFLTPVEWQGNTPIFNPGKGQVLALDQRPNLPWTPFEKPIRDNFDKVTLGNAWNFLRTPQQKWYDLDKGRLIISLRPEMATQKNNPSLIARRLESLASSSTFKMSFTPKTIYEVAGMITLQNTNYQYQLLKTTEGISLLKVYNKDRKQQTVSVVAKTAYTQKDVVFRMVNDQMTLRFYYGKDENNLVQLGEDQDATVITSKAAGGFIGAYVGMYASSSGNPSKNKAIFEWFDYLPKTDGRCR